MSNHYNGELPHSDAALYACADAIPCCDVCGWPDWTHDAVAALRCASTPAV